MSSEPYAITKRRGVSLARLDEAEVRDRLRRDGLVILRGFGADEDAFAAFVRRFSTRFIPDLRGERPPHERVTGLHGVDLGNADLALHFELGALPAQPELIAFLCLTPASSGGETVVADGAAIWDLIPAAEQAALRDARLTSRSTVPRPTWTRMAGLERPGDVEEDMATFRARIPTSADFSYEFVRATAAWGHVAVALASTKPAVITRPWLPGRSILGASLTTNYTNLVVELAATRQPVPRDLVRTVELAQANASLPITWASGDLALVDNRRCMHGRARFTDPARKILGLMADAQL